MPKSTTTKSVTHLSVSDPNLLSRSTCSWIVQVTASLESGMIYGSTINDTKYQVTSSPHLDFHGQVAFDPSFKVSYPVLDEGLSKYRGSLVTTTMHYSSTTKLNAGSAYVLCNFEVSHPNTDCSSCAQLLLMEVCKFDSNTLFVRNAVVGELHRFCIVAVEVFKDSPGLKQVFYPKKVSPHGRFIYDCSSCAQPLLMEVCKFDSNTLFVRNAVVGELHRFCIVAVEVFKVRCKFFPCLMIHLACKFSMTVTSVVERNHAFADSIYTDPLHPLQLII
ncbi:hypothetical protein C1H46_023852 [Malus baccata]|uniref:Uncharacterized protein n=1 Tax=Malus baccata TaxID=106549 RepID=A0A540LWA6_MALBA|nr:hypothetical protein C1H46_023852 [Malus baccata]